MLVILKTKALGVTDVIKTDVLSTLFLYNVKLNTNGKWGESKNKSLAVDFWIPLCTTMKPRMTVWSPIHNDDDYGCIQNFFRLNPPNPLFNVEPFCAQSNYYYGYLLC